MAIKKIIFYAVIGNFILFFLSPVTFTSESSKNFRQQKKQEIPRPTYEVEVIVTNVHVIVTDKKGKRIADLKPENFEIYEDGLLQKLTNFYEVKGMEIYTSVPEKEKEKPLESLKPVPKGTFQMKNKIIIYFDNWHLHPLNRNWSIKKLESFIRNNFSAESNDNQGMVVSLDQKLEIIQEFTSNGRQLLQAIDQVKGRSGQALLRTRTREDMRKELNRMVTESPQMSKLENYDRTLGYARSYVESERNDLIYSLKSLSAFTDHLVGIEGKKVLIYVSDGLPINPGEEIFSFLDQAFPVGNARAEAMNYDATKIFKELTARCNANEIALYPINAQGLESMTLSADKQAGWNVHSRGSGMVKPTSRITNEALELMARDTGGLAVLNTNDIESGLEKIEDDLQYYYSLGYVSPHGEDNQYHSIQVKLAGIEDKYNLRLRHGYMRISQEEKIKESVFSRLFLQREYNPMNIIVQTMPVEPKPGSSKLRLTLKILIPIKTLTLYPQNDNHIGQIKVYMALMDSAGHVSPCHELTENIQIPAKDYEIAIKSRYPYLSEMYVDPDHYIISLAVKDVPSDIINYIQLEKTVKELK